MRYLDAACSPLNRQPCTRILFVGNSYTYVNDLPTVFRHLARAAGENIETAMVANGGETLAQHVSSADALATLDGSTLAVRRAPGAERDSLDRILPRERVLPGRAQPRRQRPADGATPVLLETWAHETGWSDYALDYGSMQAALDQGYSTIAGQLGVALAPAGQAWQTALRIDPSITLWQADGSHPTLAGTYLAACVLFTRVFGRSPVGNPDSEGLPAGLVQMLQQASVLQRRSGLLHQPAVAIGIAEGHVGAVLLAIGIESGLLASSPVMEDLANLEPPTGQLNPGCLDVGHDQVEALDGAWRHAGLRDEGDRAGRAGRRELDDAKVLGGSDVDIDDEPNLVGVERLGPVNVRAGHDHDLEPEVHDSTSCVWRSTRPRRATDCAGLRRSRRAG